MLRLEVIKIPIESLKYKWTGDTSDVSQKRMELYEVYEKALGEGVRKIDKTVFLEPRYDMLLMVFDSVKGIGILNPLIVSPFEEKIDGYRIIVGNQRYCCLKVLGYPDAPSYIIPEEYTWVDVIKQYPPRIIKMSLAK